MIPVSFWTKGGEANSSWSTAFMFSILNYYSTALESKSRWTPQDRASMLQMCSPFWYPIQKRLDTLSHSTTMDSEYREFAKMTARKWKAFGRSVGLREENGTVTVHSRHFQPLDQRDDEPQPRCGWVCCPCAGRDPRHRMRMCTGCKTTLYCGTKCQSR